MKNYIGCAVCKYCEISIEGLEKKYRQVVFRCHGLPDSNGIIVCGNENFYCGGFKTREQDGIKTGVGYSSIKEYKLIKAAGCPWIKINSPMDLPPSETYVHIFGNGVIQHQLFLIKENSIGNINWFRDDFIDDDDGIAIDSLIAPTHWMLPIKLDNPRNV